MKNKLLKLGILCLLFFSCFGLANLNTNGVNTKPCMLSPHNQWRFDIQKPVDISNKNFFSLRFNDVYEKGAHYKSFTLRFSKDVLRSHLQNYSMTVDDNFMKHVSVRIINETDQSSYYFEPGCEFTFSEELDAYEFHGKVSCMDEIQDSTKYKGEKVVRKNYLNLTEDKKTKYTVALCYDNKEIFLSKCVIAQSGDIKFSNKKHTDDYENKIKKIRDNFLHVKNIWTPNNCCKNNLIDLIYQECDFGQIACLELSKKLLKQFSQINKYYLNSDHSILTLADVKKLTFKITDTTNNTCRLWKNEDEVDWLHSAGLISYYLENKSSKENNFKFDSNHFYKVEFFYDGKLLIKENQIKAKERDDIFLNDIYIIPLDENEAEFVKTRGGGGPLKIEELKNYVPKSYNSPSNNKILEETAESSVNNTSNNNISYNLETKDTSEEEMTLLGKKTERYENTLKKEKHNQNKVDWDGAYEELRGCFNFIKTVFNLFRSEK